MLKSMAFSNYPIVSALIKSETILGKWRKWESVNPDQAHFLNGAFTKLRKDVDSLDIIESAFSWNAAGINEFLSYHGVTISLEGFGDNEFGIAGILDLLVEWAIAGSKATVTRVDTNDEYPAVCLPQEALSFYQLPDHDYPVVRLYANPSDIEVYVTVASSYIAGQKLIWRQSEANYSRGYGWIVFPMISLDIQPDISWIKQMNCVTKEGTLASISQAVMQCRLRVNHVGSRAQAAAAFGVTRDMHSAPKPNYVLDQPFMMWFKKKDFIEPLFTAFVAEDSWSNPGDLA